MTYTALLNEQNISFEIGETESILEAALRQGYNLPYGCRNGECGSCIAKVTMGSFFYDGVTPDYIPQEGLDEGYALLCQARASSNIEIDARTVDTAAETTVRQLPCRVKSFEKLNDSVMRIILELPKTERLQFLPGQYVDFILPEGKRRSFSLANPPHEDQVLELHIRYYDGGIFSEYAFNELKDNTLLRIEGPLGQFTLHNAERPIIMIAGGTGFAPIKSIVEHALKINDPRALHIYWGARLESDLYLNAMVSQWAERYPHITYTPVLSNIDNIKNWSGKTGYVHNAVLEDYADLSDHDVYVCGPPPMIDAVIQTFPEHHLRKENLFSDSFEFAND